MRVPHLRPADLDVVDPWGAVVAMAADGPGIALAEIDLGRVRRARRAIPVALHRRLGESADTEDCDPGGDRLESPLPEIPGIPPSRPT